MDAQTEGLVLGFGLVMLSVIAAILIKQVQSGGSIFSNLSRTVEVPLSRQNLDFYRQVFFQRIESLGFKATDVEGNYVQGGPDLGALGAVSHARTKKMLTVSFQTSGADQSVALLTLRYLNTVVVDSGEIAYRDAVLDFVSGKVEKMVPVPAENLLALNSLIGGLVACILAIVLVTSDELSLWLAIPTIGITEFGAGLLGLYAIGRRRGESSGRWKAIAGIVLSLAAVCAGAYFIIVKHSGSAH